MENLNLIPKEYRKIEMLRPSETGNRADNDPLQSPGLRESDQDQIFLHLDEAVSEKRREVIWQMIWKRWKYYESFCNT